MTVEVAVVIRVKLRLGAQLAGQQSARQGYTSQDADLSLACGSKELFRRFETERIEDDLDALNMRIRNSFERFIHTLHAHPIVANLALLHQVVEGSKDFWHVINLRRRAMELEEV